MTNLEDEKAVRRRVWELLRWRPVSLREQKDIEAVARATLNDELMWLELKQGFYEKALAAQAGGVKKNWFDFSGEE